MPDDAPVTTARIPSSRMPAIGTLYRHFPTREALFVAVHHAEMTRVVGYADELLARHEPFDALRLRPANHYPVTYRQDTATMKPEPRPSRYARFRMPPAVWAKRLSVFSPPSPGQFLAMSEEADMARHLVPSLRLLVEHQVPWTIVRVSGELGWESHAMLDNCLSELVREAERPCICIDLTALEFCDSSGIACMVRAWRMATRKGGSLIVVRPTGYLARKLRRLGLDDVLPVVSELPDNPGLALSSGALHEHGIDPAAVFIADPGQLSRLGEAACAVQCHRGRIPGVGDDRDDLPGTSRRVRREQRVQQRACLGPFPGTPARGKEMESSTV